MHRYHVVPFIFYCESSFYISISIGYSVLLSYSDIYGYGYRLPLAEVIGDVARFGEFCNSATVLFGVLAAISARNIWEGERATASEKRRARERATAASYND